MGDIDRAPLEQMVRTHAVEHHCRTIAWGVVEEGALGVTGSYGDVDEHTVYRIASMTKSFSAAATLLLRDDGVLRLDDPIDRHAPELALVRGPTADAAPITIRDLLGMTAGFVSDDPWADRHLDLTDDAFDAVVAGGITFAAPTGTSFEYSNLGFGVLGRVVHRASGQRIQTLISERLLGPLGLDDTTWIQPEHDRWARPMRWDDESHIEEPATPGDGVIAPMGGLWTTVADLARWIAWLDDAFPARDDPDAGPLRRSSRREMQTGRIHVGLRTNTVGTSSISYGLGLRAIHRPQHNPVIGHSGGLPGYGSSMCWIAGRRLGVIALSNVTYAPMTELCASLLDELESQLGPHRAPSAPAPPVDVAGRRLAALLGAWDDDVADDLFADNVAQDDDWVRRRRAAEPLAGLDLITIEPIDDARGSARGSVPDGSSVHISYALAPDDSTRIQTYAISWPAST